MPLIHFVKKQNQMGKLMEQLYVYSATPPHQIY